MTPRLAALALLVLSVSTDALAAEGMHSRVVIGRTDRSSRDIADVSRRLSAELHAIGFEVVETKLKRKELPAATSAAAPPFAWIILSHERDGDTVEVWVKDPRSGATTVRNVDASDIEQMASKSALAVRAVEILRAALVDIAQDPEALAKMPEDVAAWTKSAPGASPPAAPAALPAPPRAAPAERAPRSVPKRSVETRPAGAPDAAPAPVQRDKTWVGAGFSSLMTYGRLGLSVGPRVAFDHELPYNFAVGISVQGTLPAYDVAANSEQLLALGQFVYTVGNKTWVVSPHVGGGIGLHGYRALQEIAATPTSKKGTQAGLGFAASADLGVSFHLASWVRIDFEGSAFVVLPEPVLDEGDGVVEGAHLPMFTNSIGVEFAP